MKKRAFTLIEILVVIAVVGLLIAIALPVMASAKKSAYKATTISNLRQCASAALLYEGDYGDIPNNTGALEAFAKVPDCDHADYWRPGCRIQFGEPLVGSYGYIRSVEFFKDEEHWDQYRSGLPNFPCSPRSGIRIIGWFPFGEAHRRSLVPEMMKDACFRIESSMRCTTARSRIGPARNM